MNEKPSPVQRIQSSPLSYVETEVPLDVKDLSTTGLLWYINTTCLHPRGLALGIDTRDVEHPFRLLATDGSEPIMFIDHDNITKRFVEFEEIVKALRDKAAWLKADDD